MDESELKRKQQEGRDLRRELGDHEYRKIKAERRKKYYEKMKSNIQELAKEEPVVLAPVMVKVKPPKPKTCIVQVMVVDENGEYSHSWEAPNLMGTVMASHRNKDGYMSKLKPLIEQVVGKMKDMP